MSGEDVVHEAVGKEEDTVTEVVAREADREKYQLDVIHVFVALDVGLTDMTRPPDVIL